MTFSGRVAQSEGLEPVCLAPQPMLFSAAPVIPTLSTCQRPLEGLMQRRALGPHLESATLQVWEGLRTCIANKSPEMLRLLVWGPHSESSAGPTRRWGPNEFPRHTS